MGKGSDCYFRFEFQRLETYIKWFSCKPASVGTRCTHPAGCISGPGKVWQKLALILRRSFVWQYSSYVCQSCPIDKQILTASFSNLNRMENFHARDGERSTCLTFCRDTITRLADKQHLQKAQIETLLADRVRKKRSEMNTFAEISRKEKNDSKCPKFARFVFCFMNFGYRWWKYYV
jgi:hypothetical protein